MKRLLLGLFLMNASLFMLAGCSGSAPTRFYVLSILPQSAQQAANAGRNLAVGVGPVELPEYLDIPQIVTRTGQNELNLADFDKWGEPLKDNANQVLAENLAVLLPSKQVHTYPWKRSSALDYQVVVKITRFDHTLEYLKWRRQSGNIVAGNPLCGTSRRDWLPRHRCLHEPGFGSVQPRCRQYN